MKFQNEKLPDDMIKVGETPIMDENTLLPAIQAKHMSPKGRYGHLVVESGSCEFVWEDDPDNVLTCDPEHPIVIFPERYHHVKITGNVKLKVEFYEPRNLDINVFDKDAVRPGENFV